MIYRFLPANAVRLAALIVFLPTVAAGYGFLSHEAVIDLAWEGSLVPLLKAKYPTLTPEELEMAHSYAYGGSVIQDLGYYPFGSKLFSDLTHYVRTGDFVRWLIRESQNANELAFAYGALAHYAGDTGGHPAVNQSVAVVFPKLRQLFGREVTYEQNTKAHLKVEFGFDMYQVATNRYAPQDYRNRLGFRVAEQLLERAFAANYGLQFKQVFAHPALAFETYRFAIGHLLPELTRAAIVNRREQMARERPNFNEKQFLFRISQTEYRKAYGTKYQSPGVLTRVLAFLLRLASHVGLFRSLNVVNPTPQTEDYFVKSVNLSLAHYRESLAAVAKGDVPLENWNFDTGRPVVPAEYHLADYAYAHLLLLLAGNHFDGVDSGLKANILAFYDSPKRPSTLKDRALSKKLAQALSDLRKFQPASPVAGL